MLMTKIIKAVHECLKFKKSGIISFDLKLSQSRKVELDPGYKREN